jgi:hypothetical protein
MKKIIIFSQTPSDIALVLSLYEKFKGEDIEIYVRKHRFNFKFLRDLKLKVSRLTFIPFPTKLSLKMPWRALTVKQSIKKGYKKYFSEIPEAEVYFFSHYFDWLTAGYIAKLSKKNNVILIDHYDRDAHGDPRIASKNITDVYKLFLYRLATGVDFRLVDTKVATKILEIPLDKYGIDIQHLPVRAGIYRKYSYPLKLKKDLRKAILFFESDHSSNVNIKDYEATMCNILKILRWGGYGIYLKPHPRLGHSFFIGKYVDEFLPSEIPGEFIDLEPFEFVMGVETTAISRIAKTNRNRSYCLLNLFSFRDSGQKMAYIDYLRCQSDDKLRFLEDLQDLKKQCI